LGGYTCYKCGRTGKLEAGYFHHLEATPPFSTSMDATWTVLQHIASLFEVNPEHLVDDRFYNFRRFLLKDSGDEIWTATELLLDMAKWTPDHICRVALQAFGVLNEDGEIIEEVQACLTQFMQELGISQWHLEYLDATEHGMVNFCVKFQGESIYGQLYQLDGDWRVFGYHREVQA